LSIVEQADAGPYIETQSAADGKKARILPAAQEGVNPAIGVGEKLPATTDGYFIGELRTEEMRDVLRGGAVILMEVGLVDVITVREVTRVGIAGIDGDTSTELRSKARCQRIVPATGNRILDGNVA
jgi:hypothetical protein